MSGGRPEHKRVHQAGPSADNATHEVRHQRAQHPAPRSLRDGQKFLQLQRRSAPGTHLHEEGGRARPERGYRRQGRLSAEERARPDGNSVACASDSG